MAIRVRQSHRVGSGLDAAASSADVDFHQHGHADGGVRGGGFDRGDLPGVVGTDRDFCDARKGAKSGQFGGADDLVADQDVGDAAPGEHFGLGDFLDAVADGAAGHLELGNDRRFVCLGVRPQLDPGRGQQRGHGVQVRLECVEVYDEGGGVDFFLAHAGNGWGSLQHRVIFQDGEQFRRFAGRRQLRLRRGHVDGAIAADRI